MPTVDPATGTVSVPAGTPEGTYTLDYQICEALGLGKIVAEMNCDTATVTVVVEAGEKEGTPGMSLSKTADTERFSEVGEVITYTITVTNTGDIALTDINVTDPLVGLDATISELAPGAEESFSVEYAITEEDLETGEVLNVARATSTVLDDEVVEDDITVVLDDSDEGGCNGSDWGLGTLFTTILAFLILLISSLFGGNPIRPPKI